MHSEGISYKPRDGEVGVCPQQQTREMLGVVPGWVQQATRRKTAREPSTRRAPQKRRSEVRTMSHKVIFLGQGTTPARRGAARRRTGKDPPARLLLPGGLTQARKARKILRGSPSHNATCRRACLECLLDFGGQFHAHLLDRKGALDLLDTVLGDQRHDS